MGGLHSGRKSLEKEAYKEKTVRLAWDHITKKLEAKETTDAEKTEIAKALCIRTAPQSVQSRGPQTNKIIIIGKPLKRIERKPIDINRLDEVIDKA
jgi:hypothetical protein